MTTLFARALLAWFDLHGRHDLPWQRPRDAYRVWVSEIMLQQTQVATVVPYFGRFMAALPTLEALAHASEEQVMGLWSGLGYYRRARHLHQAARICLRDHAGELPRDFDQLAALPGIGRSTAGAILAQAHGLRFPILDGNAKRVLARHGGIDGWPGESAVQKQLWALAEAYTPSRRIADYTQAIMDLGATVCLRSSPRCADCPVRGDCVALRDGRTAELPARRPATVKPQRETCMLLLVDGDGRVLLQRRSDIGLWPGLWSLPEAVRDEVPACVRGLAVTRGIHRQELPSFVHVFSHFRLHVTPLLWRGVAARAVVADNDDLRWCAPDQWQALGLPAPVRRLLQAIEPEASCHEPSTA